MVVPQAASGAGYPPAFSCKIFTTKGLLVDLFGKILIPNGFLQNIQNKQDAMDFQSLVALD
jgi:hypothetical protein